MLAVFDPRIIQDLARILGVLERAITLNVVEEFFFEGVREAGASFLSRAKTEGHASANQFAALPVAAG